MSFYRDIDDELLRLGPEAKPLLETIRDITRRLDMDSYLDMGAHEQKAVLRGLEAQLTETLALPLAVDLPTKPQRQVVRTLVESYALARLYPDTVGPIEEVRSTIELLTLPRFKTEQFEPGQLDALCAAMQITPDERAQIDAVVVDAEGRLARRRACMDVIRGWFGDLGRSEVKTLFDRYFPDNPFVAEQIDVVLTRTCIYWCVPSKKDFEAAPHVKSMSEPAREAALAYLKRMRRFAFQYFSHFPTFSSFDARDADPSLIDDLCNALDIERSVAVDLLNTTATIETTSEIEKYLIHDTWGHTWQADLSELRHLYDHMESLLTPIDATDHLQLGDNVVTLLDVLYLNLRGELLYDEALATRYADEWLRQRLSGLLAPIVAELTADIIEYKFHLDNEGAEELLPSSSLFDFNPAKLDFAWVDFGYFIRSLRRTTDRYAKSEALRDNLVERIALLLKLKYPRQYKAVADKEAIRQQVGERVDQFMRLVQERKAQHLNTDLAIGSDENGRPDINGFFEIYTNLLRVQCTLNRLIKDVLETERRDLLRYFSVLHIFIVRHYQQAPLQHFWNLDETLAAYAMPMLEAMQKAEG